MSRIDENGFLEGKICNWIAEHRDRHAALFTTIRELNRECHRFLDGRGVDITSELHTTTVVLFVRLMELFQGMFIAVEHGMTSVSNIMSRAHLEAYFCLMAIHRDPTFLKQYLDQLHVSRKHLVNRIRNSNSPGLAALREAMDENLIRDISHTIQEQDIKQLKIEDVARRAGLHDVYATAYTILSGAVHTTAWDLESHLDYDDTEKAIRGFQYGPSDADTEKFLGLAGMVMADALETISSIFHEDRAQLCAGFTSQFQAALEEKPAQKR
jgi:hypothetical protein